MQQPPQRSEYDQSCMRVCFKLSILPSGGLPCQWNICQSTICMQESAANATARRGLTCCLPPAAWRCAQAEGPETQQGGAAAAALKHCWSVWHTRESQ